MPPNKALQATPVDASLEVLSRGSGVPELDRSAVNGSAIDFNPDLDIILSI